MLCCGTTAGGEDEGAESEEQAKVVEEIAVGIKSLFLFLILLQI